MSWPSRLIVVLRVMNREETSSVDATVLSQAWKVSFDPTRSNIDPNPSPFSFIPIALDHDGSKGWIDQQPRQEDPRNFQNSKRVSSKSTTDH
eukprot:221246-Hanusia_phi.AAC.1